MLSLLCCYNIIRWKKKLYDPGEFKMEKKWAVKSIIMLVFISLLTAGCFGGSAPPPQQPIQQVQEGPEPDYSVIDPALKDSSDAVRMQAVNNLVELNHSSAMHKLIQVVIDNTHHQGIIEKAVEGIKKYGEASVEPVKEKLWNSQNLILSKAGFHVLQNTAKQEDFYPAVQDKFYSNNIQYNDQAKGFRKEMATYLLSNADRDHPDTIPDIVAMIQLPDKDVAQEAGNYLAGWKDTRSLEPLYSLFYMKRDDPEVARIILQVLNNFDAPGPKADPNATIDDITIQLETFGSLDEEVQNNSTYGLKKFAYNDPDGAIVNYIKKFEGCESALVRSHVVELVQLLSAKEYPPNVTPPHFEIPTARRTGNYCQ
jgi:hypothetical protein